jgi:hypothetical protein
LILLLQAWEQKHGETPSRSCWDAVADIPSSGTYRKRFGSWGYALRIAGLEPKKSTISELCRQRRNESRRGKQSGNWKGGRIKDKIGYIHIWNPEHPNAKGGRDKSYVLEHRLVMSKHIGRPLEKTESVHHINGIKDDNRITNLAIMQHRVHHGNVECPHCGESFRIR